MKKNSNGYIDFKQVIPNQRKAIKEGILESTNGCGPHYQGWWLKNIDEKNWFMKIFCESKLPYRFYVELLLEHLAQVVQIPTIKSEIVSLGHGLYGLISEDYRMEDKEIFSGKEIMLQYLSFLKDSEKLESTLGISSLNDLNNSLLEYNSLEMVAHALDYHFQNKPNKKELCSNILNGLCDRYVFLFLMMQSDFHLGNWEVFEGDNLAFLTPCFDMDMSFRKNFADSSKNNSLKYKMIPCNNVYEDFASFYNDASAERKKEIDNYLSLLTPFAIENSIAIVARKHNIAFPEEYKNEILKNYSEHYTYIQSILKSQDRIR